MQRVLGLDNDKWTVDLSRDWDVLGPFPIHAREQQFLSPSFPLNLSTPVDLNRTWPSSYADGGEVSWSHAHASEDGELKISFPEIRWASLRATEGWAALQHHAVLRGKVTVRPTAEPASAHSTPPRLLVDLVQGSYFSVVPSAPSAAFVPQWHAGNIYEMERATPQAIDLPSEPSGTAPTEYHIYVSGDYEIRLFGDPHAYNSETPVQDLRISVAAEAPSPGVALVASHDVACDFVDGWAFGDALGVGVRSIAGWWTVKAASLTAPTDGMRIELAHQARLAPSQTRIVPLRIVQSKPFTGDVIKVQLVLEGEGSSSGLTISMNITQRPSLAEADGSAIKSSYFFTESTPTAFLVIPPRKPNEGNPRPPVLALHGAGVDIFATSFWPDVLPRQERNWVVIPSGRTSWGLDWHGPSTQDAWQSLDALALTLGRHTQWHDWRLQENTKVVVIGHSNGGQGTWYLASRFPDRVLAAIPASGYIKSQAYVALTQSRSAHFIDPQLRAILESALTPDDTDLFLSNLHRTPILTIHGGDDDNVPVWHTRESVSVLKTWYPSANVTFKEDKGQNHWYKAVFDNELVHNFLGVALSEPAPSNEVLTPEEFTLTVAIPSESGSLHGWKVERLTIPGRLGRIHVRRTEDGTFIHSANIESFSLLWGSPGASLTINGTPIHSSDNLIGPTTFTRVGREWRAPIAKEAKETRAHPSSRLSAVLTSSGPLTIVVPDSALSPAISVALRVAHDLDLYHKLDCSILRNSEAQDMLASGNLPKGNLVIVGLTKDRSVRTWAELHDSPVALDNNKIGVHDSVYEGESIGALFMRPHPRDVASNTLFVVGTDTAALERTARLFPIRTGVTTPDWLVIAPDADRIGAAGVLGAGVWGNGWGWNEAMSYAVY